MMILVMMMIVITIALWKKLRVNESLLLLMSECE